MPKSTLKKDKSVSTDTNTLPPLTRKKEQDTTPKVIILTENERILCYLLYQGVNIDYLPLVSGLDREVVKSTLNGLLAKLRVLRAEKIGQTIRERRKKGNWEW